MKNKLLLIVIILLLATVAFEYYYFDKQLENEDRAIAIVGDYEIKESELYDELKRLYGQETLEELINKKVIAISAEKYNIKASKEEIDREYNAFRSDYGSEEDFLDYLKEQLGWTKEELYEYIEYYILWEEIATKDVKISEEEIRDYYDNNKSRYRIPVRMHIEQIIVSSKEEAEQVLVELNNGSDFNTLAKERSIDVFSLGNGGDLGIVSEDDPSIYPEIITEAKVMNIGDLSMVELYDGNYAIIHLLDRMDSVQYSYEDVKDEIKRELSFNQVNSLPQVLEQLKEELNAEVIDPSLN